MRDKELAFEKGIEEVTRCLKDNAIEQENAIRRDFIIHSLSQTSGNSLKSGLLLEFATIHFPDKVAQIKEQCNETYKKKHEKIQERIRELRPFTDNPEEAKTAIAEAVVVNEEQVENPPAELDTAETNVEETPDPGTFDDPDTADIPLYPGLPEHVQIGEIPEEEEEAFDTVYEEIAA